MPTDPERKFRIMPFGLTPEERLKLRLTRLRRLAVHLQAEKRSRFAAPPSKRLKAWWMGFTSTSYALYDLDANDASQYLPDFPDMNYRLIFPGAAAVNNKINFARIMNTLGIGTPDILGVVDRGLLLYPLDQNKHANGLRPWLWLRGRS